MALETLGMGAASAINPAMAAIGAVPELFKLIQGISQSSRARQIEKSQTRPIYTPPAAATEALMNQRSLAMGEAPGMYAARNQLASSLGGSMAAIQNSGGGQAERLAALTMLDRNANQSALDLGARQQDWRAMQEANLINQLGSYAKYQDDAWQYNRNKPYEDAMQYASELRGLGVKNEYSALKHGAGLAASAIRQKEPVPVTTGVPARTGMMGGGLSTLNLERYRRNPTDNTPLTTDREIRLNPYSGGMF